MAVQGFGEGSSARVNAPLQQQVPSLIDVLDHPDGSVLGNPELAQLSDGIDESVWAPAIHQLPHDLVEGLN